MRLRMGTLMRARCDWLQPIKKMMMISEVRIEGSHGVLVLGTIAITTDHHLATDLHRAVIHPSLHIATNDG
jgi:hypothetical protein